MATAALAASGIDRRVNGAPSVDGSDHFIYSPCDTDDPRALALLLPGASGLEVFGDRTHYLTHAARLRGLGFDTLVVDYKPAHASMAGAPSGSTGAKIAWVADAAVRWAQATHARLRDKPVALIAWSLGAEGAIHLATRVESIARLGLRAVVLYYPSNQDAQDLRVLRPTLVLWGDSDDVTPSEAFRQAAESPSGHAGLLRLVSFPGAHHGFDIESLREPRTVRWIPFFGNPYTFQYDAAAARAAEAAVEAFLNEQVRRP